MVLCAVENMQNLDWFFLDAVRRDIRQARQSTGVASPLEHAFYPGVHFFFLDKFAPVSLFEALWDARSKAHVLFQQPQRCVFHELRRVHPSCVAILARRASSSGVNRTSMNLLTRRACSSCQAWEALKELAHHIGWLTRFFPSCYCGKLSWAQCTY
jgi:hypothetical protein